MISIVIPVFNEAESLTEMADSIQKVMEETGKPYEVIFVDDGSEDDTPAKLEELVREREELSTIRLRRNFGKSAALACGFDNVRGDVIVTLDGDLQDDPEEIPRFIKKIEEGYDLVTGWKSPRKDPLFKILLSKIFNFVISLLTGIKLHDINCGFKAMKREVIENLDIYGELHRFIPVLAQWNGFQMTEIKVKHHPRRHGRSKYGMERLTKGVIDLITVMFLVRYTRKPLHFFGAVGLIFLVAGFLVDFYLVVLWFMGQGIGQRPLLYLGILLIIVGFQIVTTGLIGEMLNKMYAGQGRKEYSIEEKLD